MFTRHHDIRERDVRRAPARLPMVFCILATFAIVQLGALLGGCAAGVRSTRSDELSYEEHLEEARQAETQAEQAEAEAERSSVEVEGRQVDYHGHSDSAHRYRQHAEAHRQAAESLAEAELSACSAAPESARETCPLHGPAPVLEMEAIGDGVRIVLGTDDVERVRGTIGCHTAYAAYRGYEGMIGCVFYLPDVVISVEPAGEGLTELLVTSTDADVVEAIQHRTLGTQQPESSASQPLSQLSDVDFFWLITTAIR